MLLVLVAAAAIMTLGGVLLTSRISGFSVLSTTIGMYVALNPDMILSLVSSGDLKMNQNFSIRSVDISGLFYWVSAFALTAVFVFIAVFIICNRHAVYKEVFIFVYNTLRRMQNNK